MDAINKFHLRIRNENPKSIPNDLNEPLSQRTQSQLMKPNTFNTNSQLFHKRNNTATLNLTQISQQYEPFSSFQLKEQLEKKQKYLQSLIQQIVESEQAHKIEMSNIDEKYEAQIQRMHEQLEKLVQKNRMLRNSIDEKEKKVFQKRNKSPRISNQTLLLDYEQVSSFDIE